MHFDALTCTVHVSSIMSLGRPLPLCLQDLIAGKEVDMPLFDCQHKASAGSRRMHVPHSGVVHPTDLDSHRSGVQTVWLSFMKWMCCESGKEQSVHCVAADMMISCLILSSTH